MASRQDVHYFGAGPAALPTTVLEVAAASILNHDATGLGLLEQSHRSASSSNIISSAAAHFRTLLSVPDDGSYTVLFMQGGGTTQFSAVVYNLLGYWVQTKLNENGGDLEKVRKELEGAKADYLVTGSWSKKASEEAKRLLGDEYVNIAADSRKMASANGKFGDIPASTEWNQTPVQKLIYTYYCDNETVDGVEFPSFPSALDGRLVACDMSSNILSRKVDVSKYAILFAGAQKNIGGAGVTFLLLKSEILANQPSTETLRKLGLQIPPIMMHYPTLTSANSLYNTLPIFEVFVCREVMAALRARGGLEVQESVAAEKAKLLYDALEGAGAGVFNIVPKLGARSRMNICFRIKNGDEELEKKFLQGAEERNLMGLKGHRSVGGLRISNYNSISKESVYKLVAWIKEFAAQL